MKNKHLLLLFAICFLSICRGFSQDKLIKFTLKGRISNAIDSTAVEGTTLLNLTTIDGTLSGKNGAFELDLKENDTLLISHIGYQSIKLKMTRDLSKITELDIALYPKLEKLKEVVIGHKLVGFLDIDIKNVPRDKYNRIHINGLNQTYEVRKNSQSISVLGSIVKNLTNPAKMLYNLFGKKPKELKRLKKLRDKDNTREILTTRFDRELILDHLHMNIDELTQTLNECNYSSYYIKRATDLQIIEAVLECYESHKAIKEGSTTYREPPK